MCASISTRRRMCAEGITQELFLFVRIAAEACLTGPRDLVPLARAARRRASVTRYLLIHRHFEWEAGGNLAGDGPWWLGQPVEIVLSKPEDGRRSSSSAREISVTVTPVTTRSISVPAPAPRPATSP